MENLLTLRWILTSLGSSIIVRFVYRRTPQGEVLSPLLWKLALNAVLTSSESRGCKVFAYADYVAIPFRGNFLSKIRNILQVGLVYLS